MAQANIAQTSWRFGEVSPLLRGRADLDAWKQGCEKLENFVVTPQGSVLRRPGTESIHYMSTSALRLIEFRASDNDSYILEVFRGVYGTYNWGSLVLKNGVNMYGPCGQRVEQVIDDTFGKPMITITNHNIPPGSRVHVQGCNGGAADGSYLVGVVDANTFFLTTGAFTTYSGGGVVYMDKFNDSLRTVSAVSSTTVPVIGLVVTVTFTINHTFSINDTVGFAGVGGATELNGQWTVYGTPAANQIEIVFGTNTITAYTSGGCATDSVLLIPMDPFHTFTADQLKQVNTVQSADVMFFAHPEMQPHTLSRLADYQWEWREMEMIDGPYLDRNTGYTRLTISSFTDSATFFDPVGNVNFVVGDVGKFLQYREDNQWKLAAVTAYTDAEHVTADIKSNLLLALDEAISLKSESNRSNGSRGSLNTDYYDYWKGRQKTRSFNLNTYLYQRRIATLKASNGIDPAAKLDGTTVAGTLSSDYSGAFTRNDIGKYIKDQSGAWRKITAFSTDKSVTYSTPTRIAGASDTNEADLIYYDRNITARITASGPSYADSNIFASTDVGRPIRLNFSGISVWCRITAYVNSKTVDVEFFQEVPLDPKDNATLRNGGVVTDWQLGAWSDVTGYPSTVCIHEQRLVFGGSTEQPQTIWMSVSGDYWNFSPTEPDGTVQDDNAITYTFASEDVNPIVWLVSAKVLLIGTAGAEWQAKAASNFMEPLTPSNLSVTPQSAYGSYPNHQAKRIGSSVYFLQKDGTRLRKMSYSFEADGWVSSDASLASEHIMRNGREGIQLAFQDFPFSILWVLLNDGTLASVTINEDESQYSWAHHTLGQYNSLCVADSILVVHKDSSTYSRLYVANTRNDSALFQVERMGLFWLPSGTSALTALTTVYLDDYTARTLAAASTTTPSSNVPNGASVGVWINGAYLGTKTVSGGSISLGASYTGTAYVGYPYTSTLKQLPPEGGSQFGVSLVKTKRVHRCGVRVFSSYKLNHGPSESSLTEHVFTNTTTNLYTGDDKFSIKNPYDFENGYALSITEPWPLNILAVAPELQTHE